MKGCRPLTDREIKRLLTTFEGTYATRDRALFTIGIKTGLRISEILSLRIGDVEQQGRMLDRVYVRRCNTKRHLEGRSIILNPQAKKAIRAWLAELQGSGSTDEATFLFLSRKGANRPITRIQAYRIFRSACDRATVLGRLGTHTMRKTFAERIFSACKGDLIKTQQALGHRSINSTVSYLSFKQEDIDRIILRL